MGGAERSLDAGNDHFPWEAARSRKRGFPWRAFLSVAAISALMAVVLVGVSNSTLRLVLVYVYRVRVEVGDGVSYISV